MTTPPSDPFPTDPPEGGYGAPPPPPASGQPSYGAPAGAPFGQPGGPQLASWGDRALGGLIDWFGPFFLAAIVQNLISYSLGLLLSLAALGWALYNAYLGGTTGQSVGKKQAGIKILREQDGQLIGGGLGIGRAFVHIVDGIPCYIGYLWPLWDAKKQTFADKILKTVVIKA